MGSILRVETTLQMDLSRFIYSHNNKDAYLKKCKKAHVLNSSNNQKIVLNALPQDFLPRDC